MRLRLVYGERGEVSWKPADHSSTVSASESLIPQVNSSQGTRRKAGELALLRQPQQAQDEIQMRSSSENCDQNPARKPQGPGVVTHVQSHAPRACARPRTAISQANGRDEAQGGQVRGGITNRSCCQESQPAGHDAGACGRDGKQPWIGTRLNSTSTGYLYRCKCM